MTNGEKMQEVYPDIEILGESEDVFEYSLGGKIHRVTKSWWNAEYYERTRRMTNREFFFKAFPCLKQDEEWPNLLWWIDEKGKRQLLGDIYDSNFWDAEYKGPTTFSLPSVKSQEPRKGEWLRMSDLSEQEDDRYKCSHCGNVIHHKNKMNLYTFNSWCGRCGSDNGKHINCEVEE